MNIIFDLDGTLFQTRLCLINAVKKLLRIMDGNILMKKK